jgi:2-polyprenyl-3-methyl-5-hydroxy-6-metoxy-1,4-benzoquinol methylase
MGKLSAYTESKVKLLDSRGDMNPYERYYFGYQFGLGNDFLVPYLKSKGVKFEGAGICEIGCGEGGVLAALSEQGVAETLGVDIRQSALDSAKKAFDAIGLKAEFAIHDITNQSPPDKWKEHFDFVTLRDVIEHLDETELSLRHVMEFLKPGGWLYIVFPPFYSPYGAHQHLLDNALGKLPFIQRLPDVLFNQAYKGEDQINH